MRAERYPFFFSSQFIIFLTLHHFHRIVTNQREDRYAAIKKQCCINAPSMCTSLHSSSIQIIRLLKMGTPRLSTP